MKFESLENLTRYIIENKLDVSCLDITLSSPIVVQETIEPILNKSIDVLLETLSDSPKISAILTETDENIIYVQEYESIKDCCSTGKINILGRTILLNMCESEDKVKILLNLDIEGKKLYKIPFTVKKFNDTIHETTMILMKNLI